MMKMDSLSEIQVNLRKKSFSTVEMVQKYLEAIRQSKDLNIYIEVFEEDALKKAIEIDIKIDDDLPLGKLFGCVVSIKDILSYEGKQVSAASKILKGYTAPYSATAIEMLLKEDAIIIGRTNCDEFGMGSTNENSIYGPTKNGISEDLIPGGSSGAAAVSVQMKTCLVALGSDTGGSVRQPAAFCGVYGLKPSYGRISRYGLIAYASSFDQIGIIGQDLDDIGMVLEVISGKDSKDSTSSSSVVKAYDKSTNISSPRIAYFPAMIEHKSLSEEIREKFLEKIKQISSSGSYLEAKEFKFLEYLVPTYYVLTTAEASTNLSRYDGVRYGYRSESSQNLEELYVNTRTEGFGKEVKRRIMLGTYVLSAGYYDAYYTKAQQLRRLIKDEIDQIFKDVDFIILPTSTCLPWKFGDQSKDPISVYLSDVYTVLANLTGLPAINIPLSTNKDGLPLGIQLISKKYNENELLNFAKNI